MRNLTVRIVSVTLLGCWMAASIGLPIPRANPAPKDGDFPCRDHACGCMSAAMCRAHCCCFRNRHAQSSCCSSKKQNVANAQQPCAAGDRSATSASIAGSQGNGSACELAINGMKCRGVQVDWVLVAIPTITSPGVAMPTAAPAGRVTPFSESTRFSRALMPNPPPPEVTPA